MPKRSTRLDVNQIAALVVAQATHGEYVPKGVEAIYREREQAAKAALKGKNPAAVMLGRLGGLKGGPARAKSLTKAQKREIGKKGAAIRWGDEGMAKA
jgi:hypothetical protein